VRKEKREEEKKKKKRSEDEERGVLKKNLSYPHVPFKKREGKISFSVNCSLKNYFAGMSEQKSSYEEVRRKRCSELEVRCSGMIKKRSPKNSRI